MSEYHNETSFQSEHLWTSLETQANRSAHLPAVIELQTDGDELTLSYAQLQDAAIYMAAELSSGGLRKGDCICMILSNCVEFLIMLWASFRVGAVLAPISPTMLDAPDELKHMLHIASPRVVIVDGHASATVISKLFSDRDGTVSEHSDDSKVAAFGVLSLRDGRYHPYPAFSTLGRQSIGDEAHDVQLPYPQDLTADDDALLMFTSGSTSLPKGCLHTHGSYSAGCHGFATIRHMQQGKSRLVAHRPLFHAFALSYSIAMTLAGGAIVLPTSRDYAPETSIRAIETARCTHMAAIPSMMHSLTAHPNLPSHGLSSLESIDLGGDLVTPGMIELCKTKLKAQYISASHGMTETVGLLGHDNHDLDKYSSTKDAVAVSVGRPIPGMTATICYPETRKVTKRGQEGELHVSGPVLFRKYLGGTGETIYHDEQGVRWLITGDQAVMDENGNITVIGRYKDIIVRDGDNLSPTRIGTAIEQLDGIATAVVVAVEDEVSGQVPVAVVVGVDQADEVQQHVAKTLGKESVPSEVLLLDCDLGMKSWPQTSAGKINKKAVQQAVRDHSG